MVDPGKDPGESCLEDHTGLGSRFGYGISCAMAPVVSGH